MKAADHIVSPRFFYTHHGLYLGNDRVIHYSDSNGVEIISLDAFSQGSGVSVSNSLTPAYDNDEIIARAKSRLGEDSYCLIFNNCEHFVNWCVTGEKASQQVQNVATVTAASVAGYAIKKQATQQATRYAATYLAGASTTVSSSSALGSSAGYIAATSLPYVAVASAAVGVIYIASETEFFESTTEVIGDVFDGVGDALGSLFDW